MPFDPCLIYRRTPDGVRELYEKAAPLSPETRLALRLLDGGMAAEGLATRLPNLTREQIAQLLGGLAERGLIERAGRIDAADLAARGAGGGWSAEQRGVVAALERAEAMDSLPSFAPSRATPARAPLTAPQAVAGPRAGVADAARNAVVTQFAITSVNVPDALDIQEERDRAEWADALQRRRREHLRRWGLRVGVAAAVVLTLTLGLGWWRPMPESLSAPSLARDLSAMTGLPVRIGASEIELTPAPQLVLKNLSIDGGAQAGRVTLGVGWAELWRGLSQGRWGWGTARVSAVSVSPRQALALAHALLARGEDLPRRLSVVQFDSVRVRDSRLLAGDFEVVARRQADGRFGRLAIRRADLPQGRWEATVSGATLDGPLVFEFEASDAALPFGPALRWSEIRANGSVSADRVRVSHFSLAGFYGVVTGALLAQKTDDWGVDGVVEVANLDLDALAGRRVGEPGASSVLQGVASAKLELEGQGATLDAATAACTLAGRFQVRWAVLNGVNLGAFAVQTATLVGGVTRFTEFDGSVRADRYGVQLLGIGGKAGAMSARGDVQIAPDGALRGRVQVGLGMLTVQAPVTLSLTGTAQQPQFR